MIRLGDVLAKMHSTDQLGYPERFDIKFVSFSEAKKEGGRIVEVKDAAINSMANQPRRPGVNRSQRLKVSDRNPNHDLHQTLNFQLPSGEIKKAHRCLILEFNGERVII